MINTVLLIVLSFFAVIGIMETILVVLETVSVAKYKNIQDIRLVAKLKGDIPDVAYLLNTLLLQAERIRYKDVEVLVVIKDMGLSESTYSDIYEFCLENDNIIVEK